eukprot:CAMPEP_0113465894 /NCGR_PEP_ID=MMETSP0014_2-20120614/13985_1 /TAXON_ID=2857 /ORGANISM="Nitzschia sp." /LENGTH=232 /DNA_ID=CAMNT_0000358087 /DNA_START=459 /DNA_END=1157 /DNA_ORIENTATION=+ /assembly_acc=CAM_ASM_000159
MVTAMLFNTILIGLCVVVRSYQTQPAFQPLQNGVVVDDVVNRFTESDYDEDKNLLLRPIVAALKGSLPWIRHGMNNHREDKVLDSSDISDRLRLPPRGGDNANAAAAAAASPSPATTSSVDTNQKDTVDYSYDESTYVWKGNSRSMYEHSVELIPRLFRDKSRRKILKGLTDLYNSKHNNNNNSHNNKSGNTNAVVVVVVVDEKAMYHVIRETTPSFILSKSLSVLDEYSSQ